MYKPVATNLIGRFGEPPGYIIVCYYAYTVPATRFNATPANEVKTVSLRAPQINKMRFVEIDAFLSSAAQNIPPLEISRRLDLSHPNVYRCVQQNKHGNLS